MDAMSRFVRASDKKEFYPVFISHVSDIVAFDKTDTDSIKWYGVDPQGNEMYVSMTKGHSYTMLEKHK